MNRYGTNSKIGMHIDNDEDTEIIRTGCPVISISLGAKANFRYQTSRNCIRELTLQHGDVLMLMNNDRLTPHGVSYPVPNTAPRNFYMNGKHQSSTRIVFTFRQSKKDNMVWSTREKKEREKEDEALVRTEEVMKEWGKYLSRMKYASLTLTEQIAISSTLKSKEKNLKRKLERSMEKITRETSKIYRISEMINDILKEKAGIYILSTHRINDLTKIEKVYKEFRERNILRLVQSNLLEIKCPRNLQHLTT